VVIWLKGKESSLPCAVKIAARVGLASSKVRVERARNAWRKARLVLLYCASSSSSSSDIMSVSGEEMMRSEGFTLGRDADEGDA